ncbi:MULTISPECIES: DUF3397 family protein [unclassified Jeotgalibaca]|uniref:DUF3397 family protein n=1 Tax=unclassified Jeotgalibaca TaxID=2621505 RepID=UPI003FD0AB3F
MNNFDLFEIFLYVFPIIQIVLIQLFFRPYLQYKDYFRLSVADTLIPILLVGIHILSVRWLAFSLLPYYLFAIFSLGLVLALYFEKSAYQFSKGKVFSIIMKAAFVVGFVMYYIIVIARLIQLARG